MALKILQITGACAVVILVLLLIPVLLRLRRTIDEAGQIVKDSRPQTVSILKKAQTTLDNVNREFENIDEVTRETRVLIDKAGEATRAVDRAVKSPLTKIGLVVAGSAAAGFAAKRRLSRDLSKK